MDAGTAAVIGAVVGGVIGVCGTWVSGLQQAKVAARERRAGAYTQALIALQRERQIIHRTKPFIGLGAPPPPLSDDDAALAEALLGGHASSAVRRLLDSWVTLRGRFFDLVDELEDARQGTSGARALADVRRELREARSDLIGATQVDHGALGAIEAQVRKELGLDD
jgi:hypothetical protein